MALGAEVPKYVLGGSLLTMVAGVRLLNKGLTTLYREDGLGLKVRGFMKLDSTEGEGGESSGRQTVREGPESMRNQRLVAAIRRQAQARNQPYKCPASLMSTYQTPNLRRPGCCIEGGALVICEL